MDYYYAMVLGIAFVILVVLLVFIGYVMTTNTGTSVYPPLPNQCPDRWLADADGKTCYIPANGVNTGTFSPNSSAYTTPGLNISTGNNSIDMSNAGWFTSASKLCTQKAWANQFNIVWDGVSNTNSC